MSKNRHPSAEDWALSSDEIEAPEVSDMAMTAVENPEPDNPDSGKTDLEIVEEVATLIEQGTGLDFDQAKTCVMYAITTYGIQHIRKMPFLVVYGTAGTGKTTLLDMLEVITHNPKRMEGTDSLSSLRDQMNGEVTALINEADEVNEKLLITRHDREHSSKVINRGGAITGWVKDLVDVFGATVLHKREPFSDYAVTGRSITVRTRPKGSVVAVDLDELAKYRDRLEAIAKKVDWDSVPKNAGSRIDDSWAPLNAVAESLNDQQALVTNSRSVAAAKRLMRLGQGEEPSALVLRAIVSLTIRSDSKSVAERIALSLVVDRVREFGREMSPWPVGSIAREDLGLRVETKGGTTYVYTDGRANLERAALIIGYEDSWFDENHEKEEAS